METWWILKFHLVCEKIPFWEYNSVSIFSNLCVLTYEIGHWMEKYTGGYLQISFHN